MKVAWMTLLFFLLIPIACSDSEDDDESPLSGTALEDLPAGIGQLAIDGIGSLPNVTDPVSLTSDSPETVADFDSGTGQLQVDFGLLAETGLSYGSDTTYEDFSGLSNPSFGACEMVNRGRGFLFEAATSDEQSCILKFIIGNNEDFYDGEFHIIDILSYEDGQNEVERIRFKIEGTKDNVTGLTFQTCSNGSQNIFAQKTLSNGVGSITVKRQEQPENPMVNSYQSYTAVEGAVDSNGDFIGLKSILSLTSNNFSSGAVSQNTYNVVQGQEYIFFSAFGEQTDREDQVSFISYHELIDSNTSDSEYSLSNLAVGDGAMIYNDGATNITYGWNGDTGEVDTGAGEIARISPLGDSLPSSQNTTSMDFDSTETYDCSGDAEFSLDESTLDELVTLAGGTLDDGGAEDEGSLIASCSGYTLPQNSYLDCYNLVGRE